MRKRQNKEWKRGEQKSNKGYKEDKCNIKVKIFDN